MVYSFRHLQNFIYYFENFLGERDQQKAKNQHSSILNSQFVELFTINKISIETMKKVQIYKRRV